MVYALDTVSRKIAVAAAALAATAGLSLPLWSQYRAAQLARAGTREALEQAIRWQPHSAELHNRLGRLLLYAPVAEPQKALAELQRAVELGPRNGSFWADLALARELEGDIQGAGSALEKARQAEPTTPAILWQQANFELRRGQTELSLRLFEQLVQMAPEYTSRALALFSRVADPAQLMDRLVPPHRVAMEAAMDFLRRENHLTAAEAAWKRALDIPEPPVGQVRHFVDWLLARNQVELGQRAWLDAAQRGWIAVPPDLAGEPMYNADFRQPLLNFGFDWRVRPHAEASVWIEARGPEAGSQSLCVQFNEGARTNYAEVEHLLAVKSGYHYSLQGSMRSDRLFSRAGAYVALRDETSGEFLARSEGISGTSPWRSMVLPVATGRQTRLLRLLLIRPAPAAGDEAASGLVCISALKWMELGPAKPEQARQP
jgi:hypothetical protein